MIFRHMIQRGGVFFNMFCHTGFTKSYESLKRNGTNILIFPISIKIMNEKTALGFFGRFLALGFAKAVSQSNMFWTENDFPTGLDPT